MARVLNIPIHGMTCTGCASRVERALYSIETINKVSVDLALHRARISFDLQPSVDEITQTMEGAGYDVPETELVYAFDGDSRALENLQAAVTACPGVGSVRTRNHAGGLLVRGIGLDLDREIQQAASSVQCDLRPLNRTAGPWEFNREQRQRLLMSVGLSAVLTAPLVVIGMLAHAGLADTGLARFQASQAWMLIELILATLVQVVAFRSIYRRAWQEALSLQPGMNLLVALGAGAAYLYSLLALVGVGVMLSGGAHSYFEASALIVTLVLVGKLIEESARIRIADSIDKLVRDVPTRVLVHRDGAERELETSRIVEGDFVVVRAGERFPVDGIIESGSGLVDSSLVTGEPVPVHHGVGDEVSGGSINLTEKLVIRALRTEDESLVAKIVHLVHEAQGSRPEIQKTADRIARVIVPVILLVASLTLVAWLVSGVQDASSIAFTTAVSVLLVSCPCAIGLASPLAILVANVSGARRGLLVRRGAVFETLASTGLAVFDKTGTLTHGQLRLTEVETVPGWIEDQILALAASVDRYSIHPVAIALKAAAESRNLDYLEIESPEDIPGSGARGIVQGQHVVLGSRVFIEQLGFVLPLQHENDDLSGVSQRIYVGVDGVVVARMDFEDRIRDSSGAAIGSLFRTGISSMLLSGDRQAVAERLATELGMDRVVAEATPEDKLKEISRLRESGRGILFVGDGVNDAAALAAADTGIAIGAGSDIAIDAADVVLTSDDPLDVARVVELARMTMAAIRMNFVWAFAYNILLIPVAAGVLYPLWGVLLNPVMAAAAMSASSVFVVGNSLLLAVRVESRMRAHAG